MKTESASRLSGLRIAEVLGNGKINIIRHIYFKCTNCAQCCKDNRIPLTEEDLCLIEQNGFEIDQIVEELSPVLIPRGNKQFIKAYLMKKKPFVNECIFLNEDNTCRIHAFKPLSCKIYPFAFEETEGKVFIIIHPNNVCKYIQLDVKTECANTKEIIQEILENIRERDKFKRKTRKGCYNE